MRFSRPLLAFAGLLFFSFWRPAEPDEIHDAAGLGDLARVKEILEKDPSKIDSEDKSHMTPLHWAADAGQKDVVAYLLSRGANVNARRRYDDKTPLHRTSDPEVARLLIARGAELKAHSAYGTPLQNAVKDGNLALIQVFLDAGESLDFDSLVKLDRTESVLAMLRERPGLAKAPSDCIHYAVINGNVELVRAFLKHGASPNSQPDWRDDAKITPLSTAFMMGRYEIAELLFGNGARPDVDAYIQPKFNVDLVEYTLRELDIRFLKLLLQHGGKAKGPCNSSGMAPLHIAAQLGNLEQAEVLLAHKADVNTNPPDGMTPLFTAAVSSQGKMCDFLLSKGARLDVYSACALGRKGDVEAMIAKDPKLAATPDGRLRREPIFYAAMGGSREIAELLVKNGANVNARGPEYSNELHGPNVILGSSGWESPWKNVGESPLHAASRHGAQGVAELLLDKGADIEARDNDKKTPLHAAVEAGKMDVIRLLVGRKADVNARGSNGWTPLSYAVISSDESVKNLLPARPTRETLNAALSLAIRWDKIADVAPRLIEAGAQVDMRAACILGNLDRAREIVKADPAQASSLIDGDSPLCLAAANGHEKLVVFLLDSGASPVGGRWLPLFAAAKKGHLEILRILTVRGAPVGERGDWDIALRVAARNGHVEAARFLLEKGAELLAVDYDRRTALHHAAEAGAPAMIEFLVQKGIPVNARDKRGATPLHRAATAGRADAVSLLLKLGADFRIKNHEGNTPLEAASKPPFNPAPRFPFLGEYPSMSRERWAELEGVREILRNHARNNP